MPTDKITQSGIEQIFWGTVPKGAQHYKDESGSLQFLKLDLKTAVNTNEIAILVKFWIFQRLSTMLQRDKQLILGLTFKMKHEIWYENIFSCETAEKQLGGPIR